MLDFYEFVEIIKKVNGDTKLQQKNYFEKLMGALKSKKEVLLLDRTDSQLESLQSNKDFLFTCFS
jgi:hypothetical protein